MDRDLRLYEYNNGVLRKVANKHHKHNHPQSVLGTLKHLWLEAYAKKINRRKQYVLVEYTGTYQSSIINIYNYPFKDRQGEQ